MRLPKPTCFVERDGLNQYTEVCGQNDHKPPGRRTTQILAEQYNVSPKTIRRDSQVSDAIMAIGEVVPEANQAQEFEDFLNSITDDFKVKLIAIPRSRNPGKSKTALRAFINMLEDIYTRI